MPNNNLNDFSNRLKGNLNAVKKLLNGDLQRIVKREGLNHFEESFTNQGFTDSSLKKWEPRNPPKSPFKKSTKAGAKSTRLIKTKGYAKWQSKNKGRAILVGHRSDTKGGHLKDSLTARIEGNRIIFSSDKDYAQVHNEGGKAGRGSGFTMKKRQFLGNSKKLNDNIIDKITREMDKAFKS